MDRIKHNHDAAGTEDEDLLPEAEVLPVAAGARGGELVAELPVAAGAGGGELVEELVVPAGGRGGEVDAELAVLAGAGGGEVEPELAFATGAGGGAAEAELAVPLADRAAVASSLLATVRAMMREIRYAGFGGFAVSPEEAKGLELCVSTPGASSSRSSVHPNHADEDVDDLFRDLNLVGIESVQEAETEEDHGPLSAFVASQISAQLADIMEVLRPLWLSSGGFVSAPHVSIGEKHQQGSDISLSAGSASTPPASMIQKFKLNPDAAEFIPLDLREPQAGSSSGSHHPGPGDAPSVQLQQLGGPTSLEEIRSKLNQEPTYLQDAMNWPGGDQLVERSFAVMTHEEMRDLIRHAIGTVDDKLSSRFGSRSLEVCFRHAFQVDELERFETAVSARAVEMARGRYSNYLLQTAVEHGTDMNRYIILDRIKTDLAGLSRHQHGHYVVQSLFQKTTGESRSELLRRLIKAFENLDVAQLIELVCDPFASQVLSNLLDTARIYLKDRFGWKLGRKISSLQVYQLERKNRNVRRVRSSLGRMDIN